MTRDVVAVRGATPFKELIRLLNEHRITTLPVLDDAGRVVVGVVPETDLALREVAPLREDHAPVFEAGERWNERATVESPPAEPASPCDGRPPSAAAGGQR